MKKTQLKINNKGEVGKIGEDFCCEYLIKKGFRIIDRNFRKKFGEIDIVAKSNDGTLVFCEVKTMVENLGIPGQLIPEDNLSAHKINKMKRIAQFYAAKNSASINEDRGWRIDLVAIVLSSGNTVKRIHHYENI